MTMYMDGFRLTLSQNHDAPCINLFFPQWTLNTRERFFLAMAGVLLLGVAIEGVATTRTKYLAKVGLTEGGRRESSVRVQLVMTLCHGLQACMGYLLMLVTMTYSIELFLCTVSGLSVGYFISLSYRALPSSSATSPCCDFSEEDSVSNGSSEYQRIRDGDDEVTITHGTFESSMDVGPKKHCWSCGFGSLT